MTLSRDRDQEMNRLMGRRMRSLRQSQGINTTTLSQMSGINRSSIQNYESGSRQPSLAVIEKLANALGCSAAWLATFNDSDIADENFHYHLVNSPSVGQDAESIDSVMFSKRKLKALGCNFSKLKVYRVADNLISPDLQRGDEVLVELKECDIIDNEIYAVKAHDGRIIFRYARRNIGNNGLTIYANNDAHFPPVDIDEENQNVTIIGKVISVIRWK